MKKELVMNVQMVEDDRVQLQFEINIPQSVSREPYHAFRDTFAEAVTKLGMKWDESSLSFTAIVDQGEVSSFVEFCKKYDVRISY